jgi:hypothetical protein
VTVVMSFEDGTEVWYEVEDVKIVRDPHGIGSCTHLAVPGAPERPAGPYVEINNATLLRVAGVAV